MRRLQAPLAVSVVTIAVSACGSDGSGTASTTATAPPAGATGSLPALARQPAATGEVVVRGESSPASHGPYALNGTYLVRFEQYAPEDPKLDFTGQTPFTAILARRSGEPSGSFELFGDASAGGRRTLKLSGRYVLDVTFGDFPYVVRFTPRR